jgi:hypothetical protein
MPGNRIYRGPSDRQPQVITDRQVSGALLPGTGVFVGGFTLTQATSASGGHLALLAERDWFSQNAYSSIQPVYQPYAHGDNGAVYLLEARQQFQWAVAAGSYVSGQELTVGAAGRLQAATVGQVVVAFFHEGNGNVIGKAAGDLCDVVISPFYNKA